MLQKPFFSVIIPLFNKRDSIEDTIKSILNQDFKDFEIIIIDDGSTDNSASIVKNINDHRIHLFRQNNRGPAAARNQGVKLSTAPWIIFLDADDKFLPNALNIFSRLINQFPQYALFVCNFYSQFKEKNILYSYNFYDGQINHPYRLLALNRFLIRTGNYTIRKEMVEKYPFNEHLFRYEDAECFFEIMEHEMIYSNPKPVMIYNQNSLKASKPCERIKDDYLGSLDFNTKSFWKHLVLFDLRLTAMALDPEAGTLYDSEYHYIVEKGILKVIHSYLRIRYKVDKGWYNMKRVSRRQVMCKYL